MYFHLNYSEPAFDYDFRKNLQNEYEKIYESYKNDDDYTGYSKIFDYSDLLKNEFRNCSSNQNQEYLYSFLEISAFPGENLFSFVDYLENTIQGISLNTDGVKDYFKLGKRIYPIRIIKTNGLQKIYYLRNQEAYNILLKLIEEIDLRKNYFEINNGFKSITSKNNAIEQVSIYEKAKDKGYYSNWDEYYRGIITLNTINLSYLKFKNSVADFVLMDINCAYNMSKINKYSINDGLIYDGEFFNVKQGIEQKKYEEEQKKQAEINKQIEQTRVSQLKQREAELKQNRKEKVKRGITKLIAYSLLFGVLYLGATL
jgi:hypothetical protein